jgi:carbamoyl-phosphate synthase large subunit
MNLLFTSAGRRVALVRHFKQVLADLGVPGQVLTADLRRHAPAGFVADRHVLVPPVRDPRYVPTLLEVCRSEAIRLLVPLIDTELHLLSPHREAFAAVGTTLLTCGTEANALCLDKRETAAFFAANGVATPRQHDIEALLQDPAARYPVFLKPAAGSCSVGATRIHDARELAFFRDHVSDAIVQELLEGEEYTIDVLVDFAGRVRCVVPRLRIETRAGEVSKGMTVKDPALIAAAKAVCEQLPGALGCVTLQAFKLADGQLRFIEINPRFGGGFPLAIAAGADFPRWLVQWLLGEDPPITLDGWRDGVVMLRYDDAVFTTREAIVEAGAGL